MKTGVIRKYWPGYALLLAALLGAIASGVGGAVVATSTAMLVVGPGYLFQRRFQRRRGQMPTGRGLDHDADTAMNALATRYLVVVDRDWRLRAAVYGGEVALVAVMWLAAGRGWALALIGLTVVVTVVSLALRPS
jgi:hypothetical protein